MKILYGGNDRHKYGCKCKLPGIWKRHRLGIKRLAVIECDCGRTYLLSYWSDKLLLSWRNIPKGQAYRDLGLQ